jgi:integrase
MLRLYRRGSVWWVRGSAIPGARRIHESTGTPDETRAQEWKAEREEREWRRHRFGIENVLTFAEAALKYLDAGKDPRFIKPLLDHFGVRPIRDIKPGTIRDAAKALYPRHSPATLNRQAIAPVQAIINYSASAGLCNAIRVPRFKVQKTIRPFADLEWIEAFAAAAPPRLGALAWFMFLTGVRIGSATALDWSDVDLAKGAVILRKPKGQDDATAYLPPVLVAALANFPTRRGRVFSWHGRWSVYKPWRSVCTAAGLLYIPPHRAGRHGFATGLLRAGIDPVTIARLGGWKTPRHVFDTYGHAMEDRTLTEALLKKRNVP